MGCFDDMHFHFVFPACVRVCLRVSAMNKLSAYVVYFDVTSIFDVTSSWFRSFAFIKPLSMAIVISHVTPVPDFRILSITLITLLSISSGWSNLSPQCFFGRFDSSFLLSALLSALRHSKFPCHWSYFAGRTPFCNLCLFESIVITLLVLLFALLGRYR